MLSKSLLIYVFVAHPIELLTLTSIDSFFRFYHYSLHTIVFFVAIPTCQARFRKVHNLKKIFLSTLRVSNFVIEPLLVAFCVGIYLHVKIVLNSTYHLCLEEIATFED